MLVHYLNVPYPDDNKLVIASSVTLWGEKKEWTKEELISQLKPMCKSEQARWRRLPPPLPHPSLKHAGEISPGKD